MKIYISIEFRILLSILFTLGQISMVFSQTIWSGEKIVFTRPTGADENIASNQDRITANIWITRGSKAGIFNIKQSADGVYKKNLSPIDTEWSYGTTNDIGSLIFTSWEESFGGQDGGGPPSTLNKDMVVHLITDDIYIDIKFLSWDFSNGGGFSYERSTNPQLSIDDNVIDTPKLHPNPAHEFIAISGLSHIEEYKIFDVIGKEIHQGILNENYSIQVSHFDAGVYFILIPERKKLLRFIKL